MTTKTTATTASSTTLITSTVTTTTSTTTATGTEIDMYVYIDKGIYLMEREHTSEVFEGNVRPYMNEGTV